MNYVESFYTGIAGNNSNLKPLKMKLLFYTKPIIGKAKLLEYALEFLTLELKRMKAQNGRSLATPILKLLFWR